MMMLDAMFLKKASTTTTKDHFQRKIGYVLEKDINFYI